MILLKGKREGEPISWFFGTLHAFAFLFTGCS